MSGVPGDTTSPALHAAFGDLPGGGAQDGGALEREPAVAHVGGGLAHGGLLGEPGIQQHGGKRVAFLFGGGERHGGIPPRSSRACFNSSAPMALALPSASRRVRLSAFWRRSTRRIRMAASVSRS